MADLSFMLYRLLLWGLVYAYAECVLPWMDVIFLVYSTFSCFYFRAVIVGNCLSGKCVQMCERGYDCLTYFVRLYPPWGCEFSMLWCFILPCLGGRKSWIGRRNDYDLSIFYALFFSFLLCSPSILLLPYSYSSLFCRFITHISDQSKVVVSFSVAN